MVRKHDQKKLDTSGKSPAYRQHRKNSARAGKPAAGFLNPAIVGACHRAARNPLAPWPHHLRAAAISESRAAAMHSGEPR